MWTWMLASLLLQATPCAPAADPSDAPSLVVQTVDSLWLPLPGIEVTVTPRGAKGVSNSERTGKDGYAQFRVPREAEYAIEAKAPGFKTKRLKAVRIMKGSEEYPTAYVQLQLTLSGPLVTVH